ncbi:Zn 2 -C6 fungal-type domain-containing protein [Candida albicans]
MTQLPSVSELINRTGSIGSSSNITRVPPMTTTSATNTTTAATATTVTSTTPRSENSYSPNSPYSLPTRPSNTSLTNYSAGSGITVASSSFQFSQPSPGRSKHNSTSSQSSSGDSFQQHQSNPSGVSMSSNTSPRTSIVQSMSSVPTPPSTGPAPQQFVYQESQLPVQPPPQQQLQQPPPPPQQQQHIYPQQQPNFPYHNNFVSPPTYTTAYPQYYYQPVMTPPHHQHHHQPHQQAPIHLANNVSILQSQAVMQNAYPTTHYLQHVGPHHIYANVNSQVYYQDMAREEANKALINKRRIIKRRTRTGCLTCRKRRIKCDERKPTCFNCERSKKSCLGYQDLSKLPPRKRNRDTSLDLPDGNQQQQQQQQQQQNQQSIVGGAGNGSDEPHNETHQITSISGSSTNSRNLDMMIPQSFRNNISSQPINFYGPVATTTSGAGAVINRVSVADLLK